MTGKEPVILFVSATIREMESFAAGNISAEVLHQKKTCNVLGKEVGFLVCGMGLLNASIALEKFLSGNNSISHVINIGIAGSYDLQRIPMSAVCIASGELWPEYGARCGYYFADARELGFPLHRSEDRVIWNHLDFDNQTFLKETGLGLENSWHEGHGITVAGVSTSEEHARQLKKDFNGDMENMEGFALAYCCYLRSIPFMEIRTISNLAGSRNKSEWDFKGALGGLKSVWKGLWAEHVQK